MPWRTERRATTPPRSDGFDAPRGAWYAFAPVPRRPTPSLAIAVVVASSLAAGDAAADVSSWMAIGGGAGAQLDHDTSTRSTAPSMTYSIGVGSSPLGSFVLGGLFRGQTFFGLGTDLGIAVRASTGGFARGDWGAALDAGALWRPWRSDSYGEWPLQGVLTVGSPWGFQLALGAELSSVSGGTPAQGFFAALEIDLLRLTVMRQGSSEPWWPNPAPAGGHKSASLVSW
jgi:hypothetical protein